MSWIKLFGIGAAGGTIGILVVGAIGAGMLQLPGLSATFGGLAIVFVVAGAIALIAKSM